jgi:hypothetical protein
MQRSHLTEALLMALLLASPMAGAESRYPAADFEQTIIYQDKDLIAQQAQASIERERALAQEAQSTTSPASTEKAGPAAVVTKVGSSLKENYPMVLIAFALVGFTFWSSRRSKARAQEVQYAPTAPTGPVGGATAETGVARYLKNLSVSGKGATAETGVARYLKNLSASGKGPTAETGVARYLKSLDRSR